MRATLVCRHFTRSQPESLSRRASVNPDGGAYSIYFSDRFRITERALLEWGVRWDDQTYTAPLSDSQLSPRFNLLYTLTPTTDLRMSWGRYHQSQRIHELQVEDGITRFWPAQSSDHIIFGVHRRSRSAAHTARIEAFYKDMSRVRPRFENLFDPLGIIPEFQADRVFLAGAKRRFTRARGVLRLSWRTLELVVVLHAGPRDRSHRRRQPAAQLGPAACVPGWFDLDERCLADRPGCQRTFGLADNRTGTRAPRCRRRRRQPVFVAVPGLRNSGNHNTFASLDFRVSRTFDVRRGSLTAFFEISNLTNRRNRCCRDWDIDGEDGELELEHSNDYWLPVLQAVGILWEF